ncbi:G patch domain-containing protein 4 [Galendromus occidentalis]|uniref:G patch domain-containing protein 4 n=1 Tax=Galendromus occidentalis TaxID=34638 RepID=A0AAJ6QSA2_9ACAR|nr:G patch domain-containing protein 4 [Galendromus occidentalis]
MDAKALLQGMGWKEGEGLGKSNQGISEAIKPKVQLDRNGLGLNPAASLIEPWWAKVFNQTAKNVVVGDSSQGRKTTTKRTTRDAGSAPGRDGAVKPVKRRTKKMKKTRNAGTSCPSESDSFKAHLASINKSLYMGSFTKGTTLRPGASFCESIEIGDTAGEGVTVCDEPHSNPIDENLWRSCGGRTAHKGARYGVLKGKMARLVKQEEAMASKLDDSKRIIN